MRTTEGTPMHDLPDGPAEPGLAFADDGNRDGNRDGN
jgi:hypothetical protein